MKRLSIIALCLLLTVANCIAFAGCGTSASKIVIDRDALGVEISEDLYGLFIEDISFACDGGLVSNLIANTGFDYAAIPMANWVDEGLECAVRSDTPMNANNSSYLSVTVDGRGNLINKGYVEYYKYLTKKMKKGLSDIPDMGFKQGVTYRLVFYVKNVDFTGSLKAYLDYNDNGRAVRNSTDIAIPEAGEWTKVSAMLVSSATIDGSLKLLFDGNGTLYVDSFELVGEDSYGYNDPHWQYVSLRSDLYQALVELKPSFVRFPGGCLAEGTSLPDLYDWKETIGALCERKHYSNIWNDDAAGLAYDNTNAMGYHEYFQLAEDLGAKALPILNAGTICQFQMKKNGMDYFDWEKKHRSGAISDSEWQAYLQDFALTPGTAEFDAYIRDILDLIEYANGSVDTEWGAKRAANGHLEPFGLQYVGIGNENWGDLYWRNFDAIYKALSEQAPDIRIISSAGPWFDGKEKDEAWQHIDSDYSDTMVDEHYYLDGNKMFRNVDFYDLYPRERDVFVGEYATTCQFFGRYITKNNLWSAIEEAAYMCGFERNGDVVKMASYAPTFAKVNAQRWNINLIWFDSQNIVLTPNYFNQMLFANNFGTRVVKTEQVKKGVYSVASVDEDAGVIYYKIINSNSSALDIDLDIRGFGDVNLSSMQYLTGNNKAACNEIGSTTVVPREKTCSLSGNTVSAHIEPLSINVIRVCYGDNDGSALYTLPELPTTMESNVTKYTRPYLTKAGFIVLVVAGGIALFVAAMAVVAALLKKKLVI